MIRLSLTYGAVGFSGAAGYLGLGQGQALAAGAVLALALVLAGVRLGISGSLPRPSRPSRSTGRRAASFVVAFAVVSGMVLSGVGTGGGAVGTASAWEMGTEGECDGVDYMIHLTSFQQVNGDSCDLRFGDNSDMTTHTDHYQQGTSLKSTNDAFITSYQNFGEDTRSIAWSKAKIDVVNGLNAGNTSSVVKADANSTVRDYYSRHQIELANQVDRTYRSMEYSYKQNASFVGLGSDMGSGSVEGFISIELQTVNGSTTWIRLPVMSANGYYSVYSPFPSSVTTGARKNNTAGGFDSIDYSYVGKDWQSYVYTAPTSSGSDVAPIRYNRTGTAYTQFDSQSSQVTANIDTYVDGVYNEYQQGEINSTEIADPQTLASQAATDYNSSGYYSYASIHLASLGYSGNMNSSMHVTTANNSYNGTLFYTADDVDTFEVNQSYDPSALNGTAYMAVQDGENGTVVSLSETFTVESATNPKTGESMSNVTVEKYTYDSTNTSALASELDRLSQLREEYEQAQTTGGTGGFDLGGNTGAIAAILAIVVILALVRD
jgi:hypothetical protein